MADSDDEMKDAHAHGDNEDGDVTMQSQTQALADELQQTRLVRITSSSSVIKDLSWRCAHIELVDHLLEQQPGCPATSFPRIQSGIWRISMLSTATQSLGAQVLLTEHNADPARCYYKKASAGGLEGGYSHQQQPLAHPHLLNLYGARDTLYVCEAGRPFAEFVNGKDGHRCVLRVFYDVLVGMQFIHDLGFTHGSVNAEHIVVGVDSKGKLLTHFANFGNQVGEPEPEEEEETKESERKDQQAGTPDTDFQTQFRIDERAFVKCMKSTIETLGQNLAQRGDDEEGSRLTSFLELLSDARVLLDRVVHDEVSADSNVRHPRLRMSRAALELKKLAERESDIYGALAPVAVVA